MPQCWRLACNYAVASKSDGGRRVTKATTSTFRPEVSRRTSAAYRASGKLMSSAFCHLHRTQHPLFMTLLLDPNRTDQRGRGVLRGEIRRWGGNQSSRTPL